MWIFAAFLAVLMRQSVSGRWVALKETGLTLSPIRTTLFFR
jgi:hypothetical protein